MTAAPARGGRDAVARLVDETPTPAPDAEITRRRWKLASDLLADPTLLAEPEVVIPFMAWRGRTTLLAGREKTAGKTTYASTGAAKKSRGGLHCGCTLAPGRVLWTIAEGHVGDVLRPMAAAGADFDQIAVHDDLGLERLAIFEAQIADFAPDVVFVDTLASFADDKIDDAFGSAKWVPIMNTLARIARDHATAVVIIAHARKSDGKVRDSSAIPAGVDMVLEMHEVENSPSARRIDARGRWPITGHTVQLDTGSYSLVQAGAVAIELKIVDFVRANPGASKHRIRAAIGGKAEKVDSALTELC
ncbi:MAG: AAA family ATPase, partial [Gemmatimonadales bacterium]